MITQKQGAELIQALAQRVWESSTFKEQLIENPASTIESVTGQKMQSGINIIVEDQTDTSKIYLNIPRKIEIGELELSDEQLEMVAGGTDLLTGLIIGGGLYYIAYTVGRAK